MLQQLKTISSKALSFLNTQRIEAQRKADLTALRRYRVFRAANADAVRQCYPIEVPPDVELQNLSPEQLRALKKTLPADLLRDMELGWEAETKRAAHETTGTYGFRYEHGGRMSFDYQSAKSRMTEPERMLAAYARLGRRYGFYDHVAENQLVWVAINRTAIEDTTHLALSRLRHGTSDDDTRAMSAIFSFGNKMQKQVPMAWRVYLNILDRVKGAGKARAIRLKQEILAAGWAE